MESRSRYTKEENLIILSKVSANPSNLSQAFRECAQELNRSVRSVSTHYYQVLAKANCNTKDKALFSLFGSKNQNTNRKVTRLGSRATKQSPIEIRQSKWRRILNIIFE